MGILSKKSHNDKAPMNLLISEAVKHCVEKGFPYLTYAKFEYGKKGSETLKKFKKIWDSKV
jgi:predicted transcriptional regulator YdeE